MGPVRLLKLGDRAGSRLPRLSDRSSGLLLHPTSLPGAAEGGDIGPEARRFVDFLAEAGQRWWQMLPVGPTGYGNSPYSAQSAFAGNAMLVSPDRLVGEGLLADADLGRPREEQLRAAFASFSRRNADAGFVAFCAQAAPWLEDFALYRALKRAHDERQWTRWQPELRDRQPEALGRARAAFAEEMAYVRFQQWRFASDWRALRAYAHERGVALVGDLPIFVAHDSADVWQHRELFHLDDAGEPTVVAGVPPDYFSETGQRWGNPLYRWHRMRSRGYAWWIDRFHQALAVFDAIRLDHFIGFQRYWEIPASEPTAIGGRWMKGPGAPFLRALQAALGALPLIAEDLGVVTPAVRALRDRFGLPGIKILQFAFGTDPNAPDFLPHNYTRAAVAYTGTHDNDTTVGWFDDPGSGTRSAAQTEKERRTALHYLGSDGDAGEIHWKMIRAVMMSVASVAIMPVQDLLGLGTDARMNRPGQETGNWSWRLPAGALTPALAARLLDLTVTSERDLRHDPAQARAGVAP
jgi:4-alpha-glucanotransferase